MFLLCDQVLASSVADAIAVADVGDGAAADAVTVVVAVVVNDAVDRADASAVAVTASAVVALHGDIVGGCDCHWLCLLLLVVLVVVVVLVT